MKLRSAYLASAAVALTLASVAARAESILDVFKPYVSAGAGYDTNLFRLEDEAQAEAQLGSPNLEDSFWLVEAGLDGTFDVSKQNFLLSGKVYRYTFDEYTFNDYTGATADAVWNWAFAERWEGNLGYEFDRDLQDYAFQPGDDKFFNLRERQNIFGRADYWLTRSWKVYGRAKFTTIDFSAKTVSLLSLNNDRTTVGGGVDYISRIGNRIGFDAEFAEGKYDDLSQLDFTEYNLGPTVNWKVSEKTRLRGRVQYTSRDYTEVGELDFDGFTGRLTLVRNPQEPTNWEAAIYREISTFNDAIATYAVVDGVSFKPVWQIGGKTTLNFLAEYEVRDFKGGNTSDPGADDLSRKDKVLTGEVSADWAATDIFTLSLAVKAEERSSNRPLEDYDFINTELRVRAGF